MKKSETIILSCVCVVCGAVGGGLGWFCGSFFKPHVVSVGSFDKKTLDDTWAKYEEYAKKNGFDAADPSNYDFSSDKDIPLGDIIGSVIYNFAYNTKTCHYIGYSNAYSKFASFENIQDTYSSYYRKDGKMFKESVSKSTYVSLGERTYNFDESKTIGSTVFEDLSYYYFRVTNDKYVKISATDVTVDYGKVDKSILTNEEYIQQFSSILDFPFNYVVNNENVKEIESPLQIDDGKGNKSTFENKLIKNNEGNYEATLVLGGSAYESYRTYIQSTTIDAGFALAVMSEPPEFVDCGIKVIFDKSFKVLEIRSSDYYNVISATGKVPTYCTNTILYSYDDKNIPGINETIDYSSVRVL